MQDLVKLTQAALQAVAQAAVRVMHPQARFPIKTKSVFVIKLIWKPILDGEDNGEEKLSRAGQSKSGQTKPGQSKVGQEIVKEEKISDENGRKPRDRTRSQTFSISSRQASKEKLELPTQNVKISTHTKISTHKKSTHTKTNPIFNKN